MSEVSFRDTAAYVWRYWRRHPWLVAALASTMFVATLCDVFMPVMAGRFVDAIAGGVPGENARLSPATWALGGFVALSLAFHLFRDAAFRLWMRLATRVMRRLVADAFHRVQRFSADWHANSFAGATVRKISRGMWAYDLFADTVYIGFFPSIVVLIGVTAILCARWPLMGAIVLLTILLYVVVSLLLTTKYVGPANLRHNEADSALGAAMADAVTCNAIVKAFATEVREDERFGSVAERWRLNALKSWTREVDAGVVQSALSLLLQAGLLILALWFWSRGEASPGDVTFVITSYFLVSGYLRNLGMHIRHFQRSLDELRDIALFDRMPFGVADRPGAGDLRAVRGEIAFEAVTFGYANQIRPVYRDFSLAIAPGERVALVGPSGSGKSTFAKLLQRFYDVRNGRILIDGQDIAAATQESVRRAIAVVPQEPALFHRSLAENIAYGRPDASAAQIVEAARLAHAHEFIARLADGYNTLVGERGVKLSGGERQRVAIARAFLADAPILVLDEATSSLDTLTEQLIQEAIERLMENRTTIVIAHRLSTVRRMDRILVFRDGAVVEQGTHEALLDAADSHYRQLFTRQAEGLVL